MKVEDCIVSVERRTVGGCIDLGLVFARQFALPLFLLTCCFAIPSTWLVWMVGSSMRHDVFVPCTIIFSFFTMLASGAMVATIGPQVFGVPISIKSALKGLLSRIIAYVFFGVVFRMSGFCMFVPLLFVSAWCGHFAEVMFLERTPMNQASQRMSWLCKGGGYSRNLGRLLTIFAFWMLFAFGLFMIFDVASSWLFNMPIFSGTIAPGPDIREALASKLVDDPVVVLTWQIALWITFPIIRLAWFFCYLDQRIRNECWDLELQFRVEAVRLEEKLV